MPSNIKYIRPSYIEKLNNLEEIIFNININTSIHPRLIVDSNKINKLVFKTEYDTFEVNLDYTPICIESWWYENHDKTICIRYYNNIIDSKVTIDKKNVMVSNTLKCINDNLIKNKTLIIPDIVTNFNIQSDEGIKIYYNLSINTLLLKNNKFKEHLLFNQDLNKIILRDNNTMSLFPEKVIDVSEYGKIKEIYRENKKLCLKYNDFIIEIDSNGIKEKKEKVKENKKVEVNKSYLNSYSTNELENYLIYRKFIETYKNIDDKEFKDAMEIIKNKIEKKLIKK